MSENERDRILLERVRKAVERERKEEKANKAEAEMVGGIFTLLMLPFNLVFRLFSNLFELWEDYAEANQKRAIIILLSITFVVSVIIGLLLYFATSIGLIILLFAFAIMIFFLPISMIHVFGWLKGIAFILLSWLIFLIFVFGVFGIAYEISPKDSTQQETIQNTTKTNK